jgi:hypothetical protein
MRFIPHLMRNFAGVKTAFQNLHHETTIIKMKQIFYQEPLKRGSQAFKEHFKRTVILALQMMIWNILQ